MSKFFSWTRLLDAVRSSNSEEIELAQFVLDEDIFTAPLQYGYSASSLASKNGNLELLKQLLHHPSFGAIHSMKQKLDILDSCFHCACGGMEAFNVVHYLTEFVYELFLETDTPDAVMQKLFSFVKKAAAHGLYRNVNLIMAQYPALREEYVCKAIVDNMTFNGQSNIKYLDKFVVRYDGGNFSTILIREHPLHLYVLLREADMVVKLIQKQYRQEWYLIENQHGRNVLETAAAVGDVYMLDKLMEQEMGDGISQYDCNRMLQRAFKTACRLGRYEIVKYLLDNGYVEVENSKSFLQDCIPDNKAYEESGKRKILQLLMSRQPDVERAITETNCFRYPFLLKLIKFKVRDRQKKKSLIESSLMAVAEAGLVDDLKYLEVNFPDDVDQICKEIISDTVRMVHLQLRTATFKSLPIVEWFLERSGDSGQFIHRLWFTRYSWAWGAPPTSPFGLALTIQRGQHLTTEQKLMFLRDHIKYYSRSATVYMNTCSDLIDHELMDRRVSTIDGAGQLIREIRIRSASSRKMFVLDCQAMYINKAYRDEIIRSARTADVLITASSSGRPSGHGVTLEDEETDEMVDALSRRSLEYVTLKSLCRSVIRRHSRAVPQRVGSLRDRILTLSFTGILPKRLVQYLLFRDEPVVCRDN